MATRAEALAVREQILLNGSRRIGQRHGCRRRVGSRRPGAAPSLRLPGITYDGRPVWAVVESQGRAWWIGRDVGGVPVDAKLLDDDQPKAQQAGGGSFLWSSFGLTFTLAVLGVAGWSTYRVLRDRNRQEREEVDYGEEAKKDVRRRSNVRFLDQYRRDGRKRDDDDNRK